MLKYFIILIIIFLFPSISFGSEWWIDNNIYSFSKVEKFDNIDKTLYSTFLVLETIDYLQTRDILSDPDRHENNPILHDRGKTEATIYFSICIIGSYFVAKHLKPKSRKIFLSTLNIIEIAYVNHNYRAGIKIRF